MRRRRRRKTAPIGRKNRPSKELNSDGGKGRRWINSERSLKTISTAQSPTPKPRPRRKNRERLRMQWWRWWRKRGRRWRDEQPILKRSMKRWMTRKTPRRDGRPLGKSSSIMIGRIESRPNRAGVMKRDQLLQKRFLLQSRRRKTAQREKD